MNHAKLVMNHPSFRSKSTNGRRYYVHLDIPVAKSDFPFWDHSVPMTFRGHTWNEAFRQAALHLVTNRIKK